MGAPFGYKPDVEQSARELSVLGSVFPYKGKFFESVKDIADPVYKDDIAVQLHHSGIHWYRSEPVCSPYSDFAFFNCVMGQVLRGETVCQFLADRAWQ